MTSTIQWSFTAKEISLIESRNRTLRLYFALLLKHYQYAHEFLKDLCSIPKQVIFEVAKVLNVPAIIYQPSKASLKFFYSTIRHFFARTFSKKSDYSQLSEWISTKLLTAQFLSHDDIKIQALDYLKSKGVEPFKNKTMDRVICDAVNTYENTFFHQIHTSLSTEQDARLNGLLLPYKSGLSALAWIHKDFNKPCLDSMLNIMEQITLLNQLQLSLPAIERIPRKRVLYYAESFTRLNPSDLRTMTDRNRCAYLSLYVYTRKQTLLDIAIDMFNCLIKNVIHKSERHVVKKLIEGVKKVYGKDEILFNIAEVCLAEPKGTIQDSIFPIVTEDKFKKIVEKYKKKGSRYQTILHEQIRGSYASYYRRMIQPFLQNVTFCCSNPDHQPILNGLKLVIQYFDSKKTYFPDQEGIPISFLPEKWRKRVIDDKNGKVKRIGYEVYLFKKLADAIRCREIWIKDAFKHRNPDHDLPSDFETNQNMYFNDLSLPTTSDDFVKTLQNNLTDALERFNNNITHNDKVHISTKADKKKGRIVLTPLTAQVESQNVKTIKKHLQEKWQTTNLIDMLKETELGLNLTADFVSYGEKIYLKPKEISERLLLAIYGFGTNVGLKHICAGNEAVTYHQLRHIKDYFLTADNLKNAIAKVADAIFKIRFPEIWGNTPLAVACDSTQFSAYIQNLISEYHNRYGGRGVMIYWHVEKNACCIHSQLKSVSSSEVSSMIDGVLRHCTEMSVQKSYVDTHGQSEVGFAFSHLLGFSLMPRFANIDKQKLAQCALGDYQKYPNINAIFGDSINWELIKEQYSQMVKYAAAMKLGYADPESVLRRFSKNNLKHPTYKSLSELGRVIKTIFLCEYLMNESIRQEIQEGLNVVELWNCVSKYIFYGKTGEITSNNEKVQNLSVKSLHLTQLSMVYINTIMIQQILVEHNLIDKLTKEDKRALTPLIYEHVNPYGLFPLDLEKRLPYIQYEVAA
jgi:TnpA family transposase